MESANIIKNMNLKVENMVVMNNDLIKGKSELSLNEIKLLRLAIMQIVKDDSDFQTYRVKITDLAKTLAISQDNLYRDVQTICEHLLSELVYIGDGNPKHKWRMFQWCSCCSYENGIITIKLHENLKPYLIGLNELYTQYVLQDILVLKSVYAIRIYELIRQETKYQKIYSSMSANVYLSIETIRKATNTEKKYTRYSNFQEKIIDKAVNEINDKLGYYITYQPVKESRKIVGYNITIKSKWEL